MKTGYSRPIAVATCERMTRWASLVARTGEAAASGDETCNGVGTIIAAGADELAAASA